MVNISMQPTADTLSRKLDPKTKLESASVDCETTEEKDGTPEEADELDAIAADVNVVDVAPAALLLLELSTDTLSPVEIDSVPLMPFFNGTNISSLAFLSLTTADDAVEDEGSGDPLDAVSSESCVVSALAPLKPNGLDSFGGRNRKDDPDAGVVLFSDVT